MSCYSDDSDVLPRSSHWRDQPARPAPADPVVLHWRPHPCWPLRYNAGRALALLDAGSSPVLLLRRVQATQYRHALFPTDLSPASLAGLRHALRVLPRTRFTLLYACSVCGEGSMRLAGVCDATLDACRRRAEQAARAVGRRFAAQLAPDDAARLTLRVLALQAPALRRPWAAAVAAHAGLARPEVLVLAHAPEGLRGRWRRRADLRALLGRTDCDLLLLAPACAA